MFTAGQSAASNIILKYKKLADQPSRQTGEGEPSLPSQQTRNIDLDSQADTTHNSPQISSNQVFKQQTGVNLKRAAKFFFFWFLRKNILKDTK